MLVLLLIPCASAQPAPPSVTLTISGFPTGSISTQHSQFFQPFQVTLQLGGLVCPTDATFPVSLEVAGGPIPPSIPEDYAPTPEEDLRVRNNVSVNLTVVPSSLDFPVPAGGHLSQVPGNSYSEIQNALLQVEPSFVPLVGVSVFANLTATLPPGTHGCQSTGGPLRGAHAQVNFAVDFLEPTQKPTTSKAELQMPSIGTALTLLGFLILVSFYRSRKA